MFQFFKKTPKSEEKKGVTTESEEEEVIETEEDNGEEGDNVEESADEILPSHSFAMPYATKENTSPISALLRVLAMGSQQQNKSAEETELNHQLEIDNRKRKYTIVGDETKNKMRMMLKPLDEWMSQPKEMQGSVILRQCVLVTSPGMRDVKGTEAADEDDNIDGSAVKDLLGISLISLYFHSLYSINLNKLSTRSVRYRINFFPPSMQH
jgi:hypothetical protein